MCYDDNARPPVPPGLAGATRSEEIVLTASDGNRFAAYMATPTATATAQVIIYPDVRGLHQFYKELAVRFAEQGITALALDYFGRTAGVGARDDSFEFMPHVQQMKLDSFVDDATAALDYMRAHIGTDMTDTDVDVPAFTVGFCMGGALSLLTGTRDLGLSGVIAFYAGLSRAFGGAGTALDQARHIRYPALCLFGGADQGIPPEQVAALDSAMSAAGLEHEIVTYPGAPHSFFDRRAADYASESSDAWTRVLSFIGAHSTSAST